MSGVAVMEAATSREGQHKLQAPPVKPGELLPSVLRTSADLGSGPGKLPLAAGTASAPTPTAAAAAAGKSDIEHARRTTGPLRVAAGELLGTSTLPRVDPNAAHHQALPARAALSSSPHRQRHGADVTPERHRPKAAALPAAAGRSPAAGAAHAREQQPLCSSGDGPPGSTAAAAAPGGASGVIRAAGVSRQPGLSNSSSVWKPLDVPAVGSVAMTVLPSERTWLCGSPEGKTAQHTGATSQQPPAGYSFAPAAAATAASTAADDLRLLRPIDPTNPSYYWKPLPGSDGKGKATAGSTIDSILGAQLLLDAGSADILGAPVSHTRQRKSILLRLPLGSELFLSAVPAVIQDNAGHACLLVLPSDKPSSRKEAMAVEELLAALLQDHSTAVSKACEWRVATLAALCAESLGVVAEALKQRSSTNCWQFRQLTRNLTGKVLGSGMAEAAGALLNSAANNPTAAQLARMLNSKDATAQTAAAAAAATLQAAAATAPAALKPLLTHSTGAAAAAAASLDGASQPASEDQRQKQLQQSSRQATPSRVSRLTSSPSSRSSCSASLSPTLRQPHTQHQQLLPVQQEQPQASSLADGPISSRSTRSDADACSGAAATAAPAAAGSRRSTGTLGSYASLTVVTGTGRPSSSSPAAHSISPTAMPATTAVAAAPTGGSSPGSRQSSAAGCRSPFLLNPAASRPSSTAGALGEQLTLGQQQQQQVSELDCRRNSCNSPERSSRLQSSSRCGSPGPTLAPGTPQGCGTAGTGSPATPSGSRGVTSPAAPCHSSRGSSRQHQDSMTPDAAEAAAGVGGFPAEPGASAGAGSLLHTSSRLSSASGGRSPAGQYQEPQQQLVLLEETEEEQQQEHGMAGVRASSGSGSPDAVSSQLSSLYGLSLSASICMADLVRQVEVACVERGHALAYAWNCSISAAEAVMVELRCQNQQLLNVNGQLAATQEELVKELKAVDFLRREALRFRRAMEEAQEKSGRATDDNSKLKAQLEAARSDLADIEAFANKRLARLRWRNAFAVLGTWSQQSLIQSGCSQKGKRRVLPKVKMLEKVTHAVCSVEHRKAAFGRKSTAGEAPLAHMSGVAQVMTAGPQVATPGRVATGAYGSDNSAQMLSVLTPEARTMVLASMPPGQRWRVMEAMRDEERAEILVAMGLDLRKEAAAALEPRVWQRTVDIVKNNGTHAARYLKAWDSEDAATEFMTWGTFQQVDCLASLDAYTAAAVLTRAPDAVCKDLLGILEPYVAANIMQAMLPPPAAAAMEGLDMKKAMAILIAMDPNKAADVLTEMGAPQAASKLILMEADARNSILESMAPRAAANTLTSMADAMQAAQKAQEGESDSIEMLSLNGGAALESPIMGAIADLDPNNAYTIMSYMSIKDKAAMLANMEPNAVARLLACMDPNEAVLLLSALGDGTSKLVSNHLSFEDRDRLVEVLQSADCRPGDSHASRARLKGSFRHAAAAAADTVERLVDAYQAIEAVAMDPDGDEEGTDSAATAAANNAGGGGKAQMRRTKQTASFNERQKQPGKGRGGHQQHAQHGPMKSIGVQVGSGLNSTGAATAATGSSVGEGRNNDGMRQTRQRTISNTGSPAADASDDEDASDAIGVVHRSRTGVAAADGTADRGNKGPAGPSKPAKPPPGQSGAASATGSVGLAAATKKQGPAGAAAGPASAAAARERRMSTTGAAEVEADATDCKRAAAGAGSTAVGSSGGRAVAGGAKTHRTRASDAADTSSSCAGVGGRRAAAAAALGSPVPEEMVPPLQPGGRQSSSKESGEDESRTGGSTQRTNHADPEHSMMSSDQEALMSGGSTPRPVAGTAAAAAAPPKGPARAAGAAAAALKNAAAGRKALKEALKSQAAGKRASQAPQGLGAASAAPAGSGVGDDDGEAAIGPQPQSPGSNGGSAPPMDPPPQVKLGRVPKNARLIEAMAQHKNAKPKPKGWLMAVVDSIYKEGETLLRKLGRADMVKKQSVPEIVFAYFHNKYGQRALVNENVGSLVNTLTLYQHTDLRLEAFARQLSEEWDVSIFLDFLIAQNLCLQPVKVACVEYPREAGKDEQYPWVCLWKAVWVADNILGARQQAARERFNEFLQMASMPADDADVERLRRERREAAVKDGLKGDADLPDKFYKLPRIRFLLLLCKELLRINRFIITFGEDRFTAVDVQRSGKINIVAVRSFVKSMSPTATDSQVSEYISTFVSTAEGAVREIPAEQVSVPSVTELSRDAFVAGVSSTTAVRDHIKLHLLPPARLEEENEEAQIFFSLLGVLMLRHSKALLPTWEDALATAGQRASSALQQQLAAVGASSTATDARFKAYVGLLLGLINVSVQSYVDGLLSSEAAVDTLHSEQLEEGLLRLEDVALILVCGCSYLLAEDSQTLAMARTMRLPLGAQIATMGKQLLTHRRMQDSMVLNAAAVLQRVWRARQRQRQAAAA